MYCLVQGKERSFLAENAKPAAHSLATGRILSQLPPKGIVAAIQNAVQQFSIGEQFDDLTMVIARAR
jgi:serine phosphatase RsbU (regulator of sigma subunit)